MLLKKEHITEISSDDSDRENYDEENKIYKKSKYKKFFNLRGKKVPFPEI